MTTCFVLVKQFKEITLKSTLMIFQQTNENEHGIKYSIRLESFILILSETIVNSKKLYFPIFVHKQKDTILYRIYGILLHNSLTYFNLDI